MEEEAHAGEHIDGAADPIDGDKIEISWTPSTITPDTGIAEADSADDLAAILEGFEDYLDGIAPPWTNVTFVPIGSDINTYITAATAGDTLYLDAGTYTITADIAVSKQLNIIGQGNAGLYSVAAGDLHGTRIFCSTNDVSVFNVTASNVRIAHLSIITQGGGTAARCVETANNLDGLVFTNLDFVMESGAGTKTAVDILGSNAIIRDCAFYVTSTNSTAYGVYVHNDSSTTQDAIVDAHTTSGTTVGGSTRSSPFYVYNNNDANSITLNLFSCWGKATEATANDVAAYANSTTTNNAKLNVYQTTLDGADFDIQQAGTNVSTIYGGILVNNTTDGTITYGGTVAASQYTGTIENATNTAITDDTTTNSTMYPTWVTTTTGNLPQKVSSTKMTFNPSTGLLTTTGFSATNATDGWVGLALANTTADNASDTTLLSLSFNDDYDTNSIFLHAINDADSGADTVAKLTALGLYIGAASPTQTMTGDDVFISGFLEVDGSIYADGGIISAAADDGYIYFDPATALESEWWFGPNHDSVGDDNDNLEWRQNATPGTNVEMYLTPAGILNITGNYYIDGAQIDIGDLAAGGDWTPTGTINLGSTTDTVFKANTVDSGSINTIVDSIVWNAAGCSSDGTQCADPAEVTINSGPKMYTIICTDNDASTIYGHVIMPDSWDAGTVTFELEYVQTAADTAVLNSDICAMCRGAGETVNNTWGDEVAIDDAEVTGSNAVDHTTSGVVTPNGTCAAGDTLWWRWQLDATGTTTAVATLHILGVKMEYTSNVGD